MDKLKSYIDYFLLLIAGASFLPEVFLYKGAMQSNLGISPNIIVLSVFVLIFIKKVVWGIDLGKNIIKSYFFVVLPMFMVTSVLFVLADNFYYSGFIYGLFHIYTESFFDLACYMGLYSILFFDQDIFKKHWRQFVFWGGLYGLFLFIFLKWKVDFVFYSLDKEDSVLEYSQFFVYLATSILSLVSFNHIRKLKKKTAVGVVWLILYFLSFVFFFVVSGEEISWGQRIFEIETPAEVAIENRQGELNLHNNIYLFDYVYWGYLVIGFYGMFSWLLKYLPIRIKKIKLACYFKPILSKWYLISYFLVIVGYVIWRFISIESSLIIWNENAGGAFDIWEETAELFPAIGFLVIYLRSYFKIRKKEFISKRYLN